MIVTCWGTNAWILYCFHLLWILCLVFFTSASPGVENSFRNEATINWSCWKMYNHGLMHLFMSIVPKEIAIKSYQLPSTCLLSYPGLNITTISSSVPNHNSRCCLLNAYYHVPQTLLCTFQMLHLILTITLEDKYYYPHLRSEVSMTQKDWVTSPII